MLPPINRAKKGPALERWQSYDEDRDNHHTLSPTRVRAIIKHFGICGTKELLTALEVCKNNNG